MNLYRFILALKHDEHTQTGINSVKELVSSYQDGNTKHIMSFQYTSTDLYAWAIGGAMAFLADYRSTDCFYTLLKFDENKGWVYASSKNN